MKRYIVILGLILGLFLVDAYSQPMNRYFENADGSIKLLGQVTLERLTEDPFDGWYEENYNGYEVKEEAIDLPDSITIFMGTWCGDSKREVPRFVKILEANDFDLSKLKIICLNTGFQNYKQAPEREERGNDIHRVPTFLLHDGEGAEIGRIVEEPISTLEEDLGLILEGQEYPTYYAVAQEILDGLKEQSLEEFEPMNKLVEKYNGKTRSEYELNTLGYVFWSSFQLQRAEFVFELNCKLYPENAYLCSTLASLKENLGKEKEAKKAVERGLKIEPENKRLLAMQERFTR